jgi:GTP cyclohydrolase I
MAKTVSPNVSPLDAPYVTNRPRDLWTDSMQEVDYDKEIREAYTKLVSALAKNDNASGSNLIGSADRAAKAFSEILPSKELYRRELSTILTREPFELSKDFKVKDNQGGAQVPVFATNIDAVSVCPHHILPVLYRVSIGYSTSGDVIGLSKLTRLVQLLAKRAILQEEYTLSLTQILENYYQGLKQMVYVATIVTGAHGCMFCRGVKTKSYTHTEHCMKGAERLQARLNELHDHKSPLL